MELDHPQLSLESLWREKAVADLEPMGKLSSTYFPYSIYMVNKGVDYRILVFSNYPFFNLGGL